MPSRRDALAGMAGLAMLGGSAAPALAAAARPTVVVEQTLLKALPGKADALGRFLAANWLVMDQQALDQGLFTGFWLARSAPGFEAWDYAMQVGYPTAQGYDDPATAKGFEAIRKVHKTVLIEGEGLAQLGRIVGSQRLDMVAVARRGIPRPGAPPPRWQPDRGRVPPLRLKNGVYLQLHAYMLRVAIPYGTLSSKQMRMLAHIARKYDKRLWPFHHAAEHPVSTGSSWTCAGHSRPSWPRSRCTRSRPAATASATSRRPVRRRRRRRDRRSAPLGRDPAAMVDLASRIPATCRASSRSR
jgi:hypothetical protein